MNFSTRLMGADDWAKVAPEFTPADFRHPERMGYEFLIWLHQVRVRSAVPMVLVSDWRDPAANLAAGGAEDSAHGDTPCDCVDVGKRPPADGSDPNWNRHRFAIVSAALDLGAVRIGLYPNGALHVDRTEDRRPANVIWIAVDNPAS